MLNPADKARKEARKKELKKNKKQRQQVRSAAIEGRDPERIINDLENLDKLEFDIEKNNSTTSDTFFKDKRKRFKESLTRILDYYEKEDPEKHANLKKLLAEYERKHKTLERDFEAMKAAREVKIEDVFLPPEPNTDNLDEIAEDDPLMSETIYITPLTEGIKPPGCPPGLPPDLSQLVDSLKNSLVAPIPQIMPQNLMNFPSHPRRNQERREMYPPRDMRSNRPQGRTNKHPAPGEGDKKEIVSKSAVIESKPVIFMQKATKFVPSSVRPKISQSSSKKSPSS